MTNLYDRVAWGKTVLQGKRAIMLTTLQIFLIAIVYNLNTRLVLTVVAKGPATFEFRLMQWDRRPGDRDSS